MKIQSSLFLAQPILSQPNVSEISWLNVMKANPKLVLKYQLMCNVEEINEKLNATMAIKLTLANENIVI